MYWFCFVFFYNCVFYFCFFNCERVCIVFIDIINRCRGEWNIVKKYMYVRVKIIVLI